MEVLHLSSYHRRVLIQEAKLLARSVFLGMLFLIPAVAGAQSSRQTAEKPVPPSSLSRSPLERSPYEPITPKQREEWFFIHTVGPQSLMLGLVTAGFGTAMDKPKEYGPHWEGFAKRYGMRFTGVATGNAMEATFGSLWGEDPRYYRTSGQTFGKRVRNVVVMTFVTRRRNGHFAPAYARYIATPGNNFLSNTWRADSEATVNAALLRTLLGFAGRMADNAYQEFHPTFRHPIPRN
jgi:hypothetical protein